MIGIMPPAASAEAGQVLVIDTIAGTGAPGYSADQDGDPVGSAQLNAPRDVALDNFGNAFVADAGNNRIRKAWSSTASAGTPEDKAGEIETVLGPGTQRDSAHACPSSGVAASSVALGDPRGLALAGDTVLYVANTGFNCVLRWDLATGQVVRVAGTGTAGSSPGLGEAAALARVSAPSDAAVGGDGSVYITDTGNNKVLRVDPAGKLYRYAGTGSTAGDVSSQDGAAAVTATLSAPAGLAALSDTSGTTLYVADSGHHSVRRITPDPDRRIYRVAGTGATGFAGDDGPGTSAQLASPEGVGLAASGEVLIGDTGNGRVRAVDTAGTIRSVAGGGGDSPGDGDDALEADLAAPAGITGRSDGATVFADRGDHRLRLVRRNLLPEPVLAVTETSPPDTLRFVFDASESSDPDGSIARWSFDPGDTTVTDGSDVTEGTGVPGEIEWTYGQAGTYAATLTVRDDDGEQSTTTATVTTPVPPDASIALDPPGTPAWGQVPFTVGAQFTGADSDGSIVEMAVDWGDGKSETGGTTTQSSLLTYHEYTEMGSYRITLTVTDDDGLTDTATLDVTAGGFDLAAGISVLTPAPEDTDVPDGVEAVAAGSPITHLVTISNSGYQSAPASFDITWPAGYTWSGMYPYPADDEPYGVSCATPGANSVSCSVVYEGTSNPAELHPGADTALAVVLTPPESGPDPLEVSVALTTPDTPASDTNDSASLREQPFEIDEPIEGLRVVSGLAPAEALDADQQGTVVVTNTGTQTAQMESDEDAPYASEELAGVVTVEGLAPAEALDTFEGSGVGWTCAAIGSNPVCVFGDADTTLEPGESTPPLNVRYRLSLDPTSGNSGAWQAAIEAGGEPPKYARAITTSLAKPAGTSGWTQRSETQNVTVKDRARPDYAVGMGLEAPSVDATAPTTATIGETATVEVVPENNGTGADYQGDSGYNDDGANTATEFEVTVPRGFEFKGSRDGQGLWTCAPTDADTVISCDLRTGDDVTFEPRGADDPRDHDSPETRLGDVTPGGTAGNAGAGTPALSGDGRYVAFVSSSTDLVDRNGDGIADTADDTNNQSDVFRRDLLTGAIEIVSLSADGSQVSGVEPSPAISADGRFVAFTTYAALVTDDDGSDPDVYVRDMESDTVERVSLDSGPDDPDDVVPYWPHKDSGALGASISDDGRYVAFYSEHQLVPGTDTNTEFDVYVRDTATDTTVLASTNSRGEQQSGCSYLNGFTACDAWMGPLMGAPDPGMELSGDGRHVAFASGASNLVEGDSTGGKVDVFVKDLDSGLTERVNLTPHGQYVEGQALYPSISFDGSVVAFTSVVNLDDSTDHECAPNDVFVRDRSADMTERVSREKTTATGCSSSGYGSGSWLPSLSADGRYVAFVSASYTIAEPHANDSNVYVLDRRSGAAVSAVRTDPAAMEDEDDQLPTQCGWGNYQGHHETYPYCGTVIDPWNTGKIRPSLTDDGRTTAYTADWTDLVFTDEESVTADTNMTSDVFVRTLEWQPGFSRVELDFEVTDDAVSGTASLRAELVSDEEEGPLGGASKEDPRADNSATSSISVLPRPKPDWRLDRFTSADAEGGDTLIRHDGTAVPIPDGAQIESVLQLSNTGSRAASAGTTVSIHEVLPFGVGVARDGDDLAVQTTRTPVTLVDGTVTTPSDPGNWSCTTSSKAIVDDMEVTREVEELECEYTLTQDAGVGAALPQLRVAYEATAVPSYLTETRVESRMGTTGDLSPTNESAHLRVRLDSSDADLNTTQQTVEPGFTAGGEASVSVEVANAESMAPAAEVVVETQVPSTVEVTAVTDAGNLSLIEGDDGTGMWLLEGSGWVCSLTTPDEGQDHSTVRCEVDSEDPLAPGTVAPEIRIHLRAPEERAGQDLAITAVATTTTDETSTADNKSVLETHLREPVVADAGADRTGDTTVWLSDAVFTDEDVEAAEQVVALDASLSTGEDGVPLEYEWEQLCDGGLCSDDLAVAWTGMQEGEAQPHSARAAFGVGGWIERITEATTLTFEVTVSDGSAMSTDTVEVELTPPQLQDVAAPPEITEESGQPADEQIAPESSEPGEGGQSAAAESGDESTPDATVTDGTPANDAPGASDSGAPQDEPETSTPSSTGTQSQTPSTQSAAKSAPSDSQSAASSEPASGTTESSDGGEDYVSGEDATTEHVVSMMPGGTLILDAHDYFGDGYSQFKAYYNGGLYLDVVKPDESTAAYGDANEFDAIFTFRQRFPESGQSLLVVEPECAADDCPEGVKITVNITSTLDAFCAVWEQVKTAVGLGPEDSLEASVELSDAVLNLDPIGTLTVNGMTVTGKDCDDGGATLDFDGAAFSAFNGLITAEQVSGTITLSGLQLRSGTFNVSTMTKADGEPVDVAITKPLRMVFGDLDENTDTPALFPITGALAADAIPLIDPQMLEDYGLENPKFWIELGNNWGEQVITVGAQAKGEEDSDGNQPRIELGGTVDTAGNFSLKAEVADLIEILDRQVDLTGTISNTTGALVWDVTAGIEGEVEIFDGITAVPGWKAQDPDTSIVAGLGSERITIETELALEMKDASGPASIHVTGSIQDASNWTVTADYPQDQWAWTPVEGVTFQGVTASLKSVDGEPAFSIATHLTPMSMLDGALTVEETDVSLCIDPEAQLCASNNGEKTTGEFSLSTIIRLRWLEGADSLDFAVTGVMQLSTGVLVLDAALDGSACADTAGTPCDNGGEWEIIADELVVKKLSAHVEYGGPASSLIRVDGMITVAGLDIGASAQFDSHPDPTTGLNVTGYLLSAQISNGDDKPWAPIEGVELYDAAAYYSNVARTVQVNDDQFQLEASQLTVSAEFALPASVTEYFGWEDEGRVRIQGRFRLEPSIEIDFTAALSPSSSDWYLFGSPGEASLRLDAPNDGDQVAADSLEIRVQIDARTQSIGLGGSAHLVLPGDGGMVEVRVESGISLALANGVPTLSGFVSVKDWANAFGIDGLKLVEGTVQISLSTSPVPGIGIAAQLQLPSETAARIGMQPSDVISMAMNLDLAAPCFAFSVGEHDGKESLDPFKLDNADPAIEDANDRWMFIDYFELVLAPTGSCTVGQHAYSGTAVKFDGEMFGASSTIDGKIQLEDGFAVAADVALDQFSVGAVTVGGATEGQPLDLRLRAGFDDAGNRCEDCFSLYIDGGISVGESRVGVKGGFATSEENGTALDLTTRVDSVGFDGFQIKNLDVAVKFRAKDDHVSAWVEADGVAALLGCEMSGNFELTYADSRLERLRAAIEFGTSTDAGANQKCELADGAATLSGALSFEYDPDGGSEVSGKGLLLSVQRSVDVTIDVDLGPTSASVRGELAATVLADASVGLEGAIYYGSDEDLAEEQAKVVTDTGGTLQAHRGDFYLGAEVDLALGSIQAGGKVGLGRYVSSAGDSVPWNRAEALLALGTDKCSDATDSSDPLSACLHVAGTFSATGYNLTADANLTLFSFSAGVKAQLAGGTNAEGSLMCGNGAAVCSLLDVGIDVLGKPRGFHGELFVADGGAVRYLLSSEEYPEEVNGWQLADLDFYFSNVPGREGARGSFTLDLGVYEIGYEGAFFGDGGFSFSKTKALNLGLVQSELTWLFTNIAADGKATSAMTLGVDGTASLGLPDILAASFRVRASVSADGDMAFEAWSPPSGRANASAGVDLGWVEARASYSYGVHAAIEIDNLTTVSRADLDVDAGAELAYKVDGFDWVTLAGLSARGTAPDPFSLETCAAISGQDICLRYEV